MISNGSDSIALRPVDMFAGLPVVKYRIKHRTREIVTDHVVWRDVQTTMDRLSSAGFDWLFVEMLCRRGGKWESVTEQEYVLMGKERGPSVDEEPVCHWGIVPEGADPVLRYETLLYVDGKWQLHSQNFCFMRAEEELDIFAASGRSDEKSPTYAKIRLAAGTHPDDLLYVSTTEYVFVPYMGLGHLSARFYEHYPLWSILMRGPFGKKE